jgi:FkbM family methyltransferase
VTSVFTVLRDLKRRYVAEKYRKKNGDTYRVHGLEVTVPGHISPGIRYILAKGRPYEADEIKLVVSILKKGANVIELGGSIGLLSRVIRNKIGPTATHFIIEADPSLIDTCRQNSEIGSENGKTKVLHAAVAYVDTPTLAFKKGKTAHTGKIATSGEKDSIQVPAVRLKELIQKVPKGEDLILVSDIEGAEYEMFEKESREVFSNFSYAIIEIDPKSFQNLNKSEAEFEKIIVEKGFSLIRREENVLLLRGSQK